MVQQSNAYWWVDLVGVVALTLLAATVVLVGLGGFVRVVALAPLVLFLPGYALVGAVFPRRMAVDYRPFDGAASDSSGSWTPDGLDGVERAAISVVGSVALVPLVVLVATLAGSPITLPTVAAGTVGVTLVAAVVAFARRAAVDPAERFALSRPRLGFEATPSDRLGHGGGSAFRHNAALALSLLLVVASVGFAAAAPPPSNGYTELYVTNVSMTGNGTPAFPTTLTQGETTPLPVSVGNHEGDEQTYEVVVLSRDGGANDTGSTLELDRRQMTIPANETLDLEMNVTPTRTGDRFEVLVVLYRGTAPSDPSPETAYRTLRLPVDRIRSGGGSGR